MYNKESVSSCMKALVSILLTAWLPIGGLEEHLFTDGLRWFAFGRERYMWKVQGKGRGSGAGKMCIFQEYTQIVLLRSRISHYFLCITLFRNVRLLYEHDE